MEGPGGKERMAPRRFRARARSAFPTEYGEDTGEEATDSERARARERWPFFSASPCRSSARAVIDGKVTRRERERERERGGESEREREREREREKGTRERG